MALGSPFSAAFSDPGGPEANPNQTSFTLPDVQVTPDQKDPLGVGGGQGASTEGETQVASRSGGLPTSNSDLPTVAQDVARQWLAAGYTPEQVSGVLGGMNQEAPGFDPRAQNQSSGATGLYQHLGPRLDALQQYLNQTNSDWFDHKAQTGFALSELRGPEAAADRAIRGSKTAEQAALAYGQKFMRPGPGGTPSYYRAAQANARSYLPGVQKIAQESQVADASGQTAGGAPTPTPVNYQELAQGWDDEADHPANQPLPQGVSTGAVKGSAGYYANMLKGWDDESAPTNPARYGVPPAPGVMHQLGHAASYLPAMAWRAAAATMGWRADALNAFTSGQEWVQRKLGLNPKPAPMLGETQEEQAQRQAYGAQQEEQAYRAQKFDPEATAAGLPGPEKAGPEVPAPQGSIGKLLRSPTTENFSSLGGMITPPQLPSEVGDTDSVARYLETFGMPALMVAAQGLPKATSAALVAGGGVPKVIGRIGKSTAANAAIGTSIFGLGDELGQDISGSRGGTPEAQAWGSGISLAAEAARLALFKGGSLAAGSTPGLFDKFILGKVGPGPNLRENITDPNMALANLRDRTSAPPSPATVQFNNMVNGGNFAALQTRGGIENLVPGFQTTGAAASGDNGAQALFNLHRHTNAQVEGRFNDILRNNSNAIDNASQGVIPGSGGVPNDAISYLRTELEADRDAMETRVNDAGREANARAEAITRDLGVGPDHILAREALGNSTRDALWEADRNLKNYSDWRWNNARQAGIMDVPVADADAAANLHNPLQALMAQAIRSGQEEHFPWDAVKGLYSGNPRNLFNAEGDLAGTRRSNSNIISHIGPDGNPVFEGQQGPMTNAKHGLTIGSVREIQSDLESDIRQERKSVTSPFTQGDPKKLRWQTSVAQVLNDTMDHTLENSGSGNTALYRLATGATAQRYSLMHQGVVGQLLGRNLQGGEASVASPQTLEKLVPGGTGGAAATRQLFDVIHAQHSMQQGLDPATGMPTPGMPTGQPPGQPLNAAGPAPQHPADILHQNLENQLRLDFGQNMRNGGPEHGQRWLENHSVALEAFPGLKDDIQRSIASGATYAGLQDQMSNFDKQAGHSASSLFLGGDAGKEIDYVTRSGRPVEAMNNLLDQAAADHTGAAGRGIARMFFDRMRSEAVDPITHDYNPGAVAKFWQAHSGTFGALADRGLIDRKALGQIVNSFKELDRMHANPGAVLQTPASAQLSLPFLADKAFRVAGAAVGREMHSGTIQVPGITADIASKIGGAMFSKLSAAGAKNLQADLLFDPAKLQHFLEAGTAATQGKGTALMEKLLSPYVKAAPSITALQANKQPGPQTQPDATGKVAPNSANGGW